MTDLQATIEGAKTVLEYCGGDQAEVTMVRRRGGLTRYANSAIHQNVDSEVAEVVVRIVEGGRIGVASGRGSSVRDAKVIADEALAIARQLEPTPGFESLPRPAPVTEAPSFDEATAQMGPAERAAFVGRIVSAAGAVDAQAAGSFQTGSADAVIVNSLGLEAAERQSHASGTAMFLGGEGTAWDAFQSQDASRIDPDTIAGYLQDRYRNNRDAVDIEPGEYTVVLEPKAAATLIGFTAYIGFGARAFLEGRSFVSNRIGEKIVGENVTLWDDAYEPAGSPTAFDGEGVPKRKLMLIEEGVARNVAYDSLYAARAGVETTGHALGRGVNNPLPTNLVMPSGDASMEDLIAGVDRGLLVSRFHYTNVAEPNRAVLTGMTRDGTFLIEHGKVTRAVKNLRYTQSMIEAFDRVTGIGRERVCLPGMGNPLAPALRIEGFRFTGRIG